MRPQHRFLAATLSLLLAPVAPALAWQADHLANQARQARDTLASEPLNEADRGFVEFAIDRSRMKAQAMEIAMARAASPEVRVLADALYAEHRALTEGLLQLAPADSPAVATDVGDHSELARLREVPDAGFDRLFIDTMRRTHRETLPRYQAAAADPAASERVRQHAQDAIPVIELHETLMDDTDQLLAEAQTDDS
jgi:predicted outer membrane protein